MWGRITGVVLAALALVGCVTVAPRSISLDDVRSFRVSAVEVQAAPDANIQWSDGEAAYMQTTGQGATVNGLSAPTPEAQAFLRQQASERLRAALEKRLPTVMAGSRPVRVVTTIKAIDVPSAGGRILVGGHNVLQADTVVLDAKTGLELTAYRNGQAMDRVGQGIGGVLVQAAIDSGRGSGGYDKLTKTYTDNFMRWLTGA